MKCCCPCFNLHIQRERDEARAAAADALIQELTSNVSPDITQIKQALMYNNLGDVEIGNYSSSISIDHGFYTMEKLMDPLQIALDNGDLIELAPAMITGYKLHIAIDDSIDGNMERGWNIVKDILIDHGIHASKVAMPGMGFANNSEYREQQGKQITVYACYNPDAQWNDICQEITIALADNNVTPANFSTGNGEQVIRGSNYISYRSDLNDRRQGYGPYRTPTKEEKSALNKIEEALKEALADIQVNVDNQPQPQIITRQPTALQTMFS